MDMDIEELIQKGEALLRNVRISDFGSYICDTKGYKEWTSKSLMFLQSLYPSHPQTERYEFWVKRNMEDVDECKHLLAILKAFKEINPKTKEVDFEKILAKIFENFHIFVRQLKRRHNGRSTFEVNDEYDVQDLLNAILRLHFEDVRPEEWTPSYAGGSNRMDFLLKNEEISIEVKMTRDGLKDNELGEQLIIDIAKYKAHPNCKTLYCFVFDPDGYIRNPRGLEKDLTKEHDGLSVKVYIRPL